MKYIFLSTRHKTRIRDFWTVTFVAVLVKLTMWERFTKNKNLPGVRFRHNGVAVLTVSANRKGKKKILGRVIMKHTENIRQNIFSFYRCMFVGDSHHPTSAQLWWYAIHDTEKLI